MSGAQALAAKSHIDGSTLLPRTAPWAYAKNQVLEIRSCRAERRQRLQDRRRLLIDPSATTRDRLGAEPLIISPNHRVVAGKNKIEVALCLVGYQYPPKPIRTSWRPAVTTDATRRVRSVSFTTTTSSPSDAAVILHAGRKDTEFEPGPHASAEPLYVAMKPRTKSRCLKMVGASKSAEQEIHRMYRV